ncbi:MAG: hypothetical protein M3N31_08375 [Actinomycetota bacterium]|nr:hypothetical protein [Actinomycetota bacterium]
MSCEIATLNTLIHRSDNNGRDGIRVLLGSITNDFIRNSMFSNDEHDAHDENRPATLWIGNRCRTDPPGTICEHGGP